MDWLIALAFSHRIGLVDRFNLQWVWLASIVPLRHCATFFSTIDALTHHHRQAALLQTNQILKEPALARI